MLWECRMKTLHGLLDILKRIEEEHMGVFVFSTFLYIQFQAFENLHRAKSCFALPSWSCSVRNRLSLRNMSAAVFGLYKC